jgi:hypothetical protein
VSDDDINELERMLSPENLLKARKAWKELGLEGSSKNPAFAYMEINTWEAPHPKLRLVVDNTK